MDYRQELSSTLGEYDTAGYFYLIQITTADMSETKYSPDETRKSDRRPTASTSRDNRLTPYRRQGSITLKFPTPAKIMA